MAAAHEAADLGGTHASGLLAIRSMARPADRLPGNGIGRLYQGRIAAVQSLVNRPARTTRENSGLRVCPGFGWPVPWPPKDRESEHLDRAAIRFPFETRQHAGEASPGKAA